mmetsp:Transcript_26187/g.42134  ORF Transcript_26187/g.42134 Transcript_26187/m.42134 type:complete len:161 (-) Transcript_26187:97-579(-)|eukprot:jgi/Bigna1/141372/aug1.62_g16080
MSFGYVFSPYAFLPLHLVFIPILGDVYAGTLGKTISYTWFTFFVTVQYLIEHWTHLFPTIGVLNGPFTLFGLLQLLGFLYLTYKKSAPITSILNIVLYFGMVGVAKACDLGFPKDDAEEQVVALQDPHYSACHMIFHLLISAQMFFMYYSAKSDVKAKSA